MIVLLSKIGGFSVIINNLIIGTDSCGHKLQCGDICSFHIRNRKEEISDLKGMIVYDEDSYAFVFETLDDYAPILCMCCAEYGTVKKLFEANEDNFNNVPDGKRWKEIYNNNLITIK